MHDQSAIIHMGGPKTGTSAIQAFLAKNRKKLCQDGVDYPSLEDLGSAESGGVTSGNGVSIALAFQQDKSGESSQYCSYLQVLKSSQATAVLISSEHFAYSKREQLEIIKADVEATGRTLKLVLYIRPQIESVISFYAQRIKRHGESGPLERFWRANERAFDYLPRITQYAAVVGRENLDVRVYLRGAMVGNDVTSDFGSYLGIDFASYERFSHEINPTPGAHDLALLRYLNRFESGNGEFDISDALLDMMAKEKGPIRPETKLWVSEKLSAQICAHYAEANSKISETYLNNVTIAADSGKPDQFHEADRLPEPGPVVKGLAKLYLSMFTTVRKQQQSIIEIQKRLNISNS